MKTLAFALVLLVGCAPLVRHSRCEADGLPCPSGTSCERIAAGVSSCVAPCDRVCAGPDTLAGEVCLGGACLLPCDVRDECPAGLSCTPTELGLRCL